MLAGKEAEFWSILAGVSKQITVLLILACSTSKDASKYTGPNSNCIGSLL